MSQPGSANLLAEIRRGSVDVRWLVRIDITVPSSLSLYFATSDTITPDGQSWDAGLVGDPIDDSIEFMGPGPNVVSWRFSIANRVLSLGAVRLDSLLHSYQFKGAKVTLYTWPSALANFADALPELVDCPIIQVDPETTKVSFTCTQNTRWDAVLPTKTIDTTTAPNASDAVIGLGEPIIAGNWKKPDMPAPFVNNSGEIIANDESGGGRLAVPFLLTDPGVGAADVKIVAACHHLSSLFDQNNGYGVFTPGNGGLLAYFGTGGTAIVQGVDQSYITVDDGQAGAVAGIPPCAVNTAGAAFVNAATNPRAAMNPLDQSQFASIDQNLGTVPLCLLWPDASNLGKETYVHLVVAFSGDAANDITHKLRVRLVNPSTGAVANTFTSTNLELRTPGVTIMTLGTAYFPAWRYGSGIPNGSAICIDFDGGTTNKAKVYFCAITTAYAPERGIVIPEVYGIRSLGRHKGRDTRIMIDAAGNQVGTYSGHLPDMPDRPAVYKLDTTIYGNVAGPVDSVGSTGYADATFTGAAGALIEKPADIIRWLCAKFGGADPVADFETTVGEFGSFADVGSLLRAGWPKEFTSAIYIGSETKISEVVKNIASSCLFAVTLDRFTNLWKIVPWFDIDTADYDLTFTWDHINLSKAESLNALDSCQEVRVQYGFDHYSQRPVGEAYISPSGSGVGNSAISKRDQRQIVITAGVNDWLDVELYNPITTVAVVTSKQLAPATYDNPIDFASYIQGLFAPSPSHPNPYVGWSLCVKAGYNDTIGIRNGTFAGTIYTATLTSGDMSAVRRAADVQRALNATGFPGTFTVTFSETTGKFTVACTANFSLLNDTNPVATSYAGWHVLGFVGPRVGASSYIGDVARYPERYYFDAILSPDATSPLHGVTEVQVRLKFGSGAHATTTPAFLLGFLAVDTARDAGVYSDYPRNTREVVAVAAKDENGPRTPDTFTADVLIEESVAARVRNLRFDLRTTDRVVVVFDTTFAPDLQKLRTIKFDSSLDAHVAFPRYGSDGSWAGKRFRAIRVTKYLANAQAHSEITAIEMR